jgi:hypothetical protein
MGEPHHYVADNIVRILGLALMVLAAGWMAFSVLFGFGLAIAWISESGWTEELQPWVLSIVAVSVLSAAIGYAVFFVGRRLRQSR